MSTRRILGTGLALATLSGCHQAIFVPPARPLPLESAATLSKDETGVAAEFGQHGAIFGVEAWSGAARVRRGVAEGTDVSAEAAVVHVNGRSAADTMKEIYSARFGIKHEFVPRLVSVTGGLGGGYSAGGGFVGPDIGPILAFENPYFVPFVTVRGGFSAPIASRSVDISQDTRGTAIETPRLTWNLGTTIGCRIPIGGRDYVPGDLRGSILGGVGVLHLAHAHDKETVAQLGLGFELAF